MDIGGTAKKVQKATKIAEQTYKKMQAMTERMKDLQEDMETTSGQVDEMEYELAEQRALLEAVATEQGLDVEDVLADADLPEPPQTDEGETVDESNGETDEPATDSGESGDAEIGVTDDSADDKSAESGE